MTDKIVLISPALHFISTGRGKMHAIDAEKNRFNTLCGKNFIPGTQAQVSRKLDPAQVCGSCRNCLKPYYRAGKVTIESEPQA